MPPVFLDANIPMYMVGGDHPNRALAGALTDRFAKARVPMVTDAEVFQEILHRYHSINRQERIQPCFDLVLALVSEVLPLDLATVQTAKSVLDEVRGLSARDAIHVAAMRVHHVFEIASFDADYDRVPGIRRISS